MAVTWNATLEGLKTVGSLSDVVTTIHWTASDSETLGSGDSAVTHTGSSYGAVALAEANSGSFTAYADITKETAIAWAKAAMGADQVTAVEASIAAQIAESKTPTRFTGTPWS